MKKFANEKSTSTNLKVCPTKENLESDYGLYERLKGIVYEDKHAFRHHIHVSVAIESDEFIRQQVAYYSYFLDAMKAKFAAGAAAKVNSNGPPLPVDVVWHTHQMHYDEYERDCVERLGVPFAHVPKPRSLEGVLLCGAARSSDGETVPRDVVVQMTMASWDRFAHEQHGVSLNGSVLGFDPVDADQNGFNSILLQDWILEECLALLCDDLAASVRQSELRGSRQQQEQFIGVACVLQLDLLKLVNKKMRAAASSNRLWQRVIAPWFEVALPPPALATNQEDEARSAVRSTVIDICKGLCGLGKSPAWNAIDQNDPLGTWMHVLIGFEWTRAILPQIQFQLLKGLWPTATLVVDRFEMDCDIQMDCLMA